MASGNRLASETSPYLLQHADNPVDWYPWSEEAFARARAEDKPIFLSVGYAACHWCHVMERESFENSDTAAKLNAGFVSIKVDREERPDVDAIYMDAVQSMTGSGGWPMSVFLTPDGKPFYAGTYYPDEPRHGMPSFRQVLAGISDAWGTRRTDVEEQGAHVARAIEQAILSAERTPMSVAIADDAFAALLPSFDARQGGFGGAPKFPQPMILEWLLRQAVRGRSQALEMVVVTLDRMAAGGLQDQVGGGFARYSTDASWHVPHFEKMLPDNAQLLQLYTNAWLFTREERYRDVAVRTADYLLREMQQPNGGFSTSQDADSEGVEGKFFVWGWEELVAAVGQPIAEAFGAVPGGNWEGTNVLWLPAPLDEIARRYEIDGASLRTDVDEARATLFKVREHRAAPAVDDKVIVGWNGLAIRALAVAGRSMDVARYVEAALACATFTWDSMRDADGRLLRSWRAGTARVPAFLDDHALLGLGLITLYETTGDVSWFERAGTLAEQILDLFSDPAGGFYLAAHDAEPLVVRPKELLDTAVPSGNSAAAELLLRLSLYTGERRFEDAAARAIELVMEPARRHPSAFGHALNVADLALGPVAEIAIVGHHGSDQRAELIREVVGRYLPNAVLAVGTGAAGAEPVPLLRDKPALDGQAMAYVCERFACQAPVVDPLALRLQLGSTS